MEELLAFTASRKNAIFAPCLSLGTYLFLWHGLPEDFLEKEKGKQIKFLTISMEGSESLLVLSALELPPTLPSSSLPLLIQPVISLLNHKNGNPICLACSVLLLWSLHNPVAKEPSSEHDSDQEVPLSALPLVLGKRLSSSINTNRRWWNFQVQMCSSVSTGDTETNKTKTCSPPVPRTLTYLHRLFVQKLLWKGERGERAQLRKHFFLTHSVAQTWPKSAN